MHYEHIFHPNENTSSTSSILSLSALKKIKDHKANRNPFFTHQYNEDSYSNCYDGMTILNPQMAMQLTLILVCSTHDMEQKPISQNIEAGSLGYVFFLHYAGDNLQAARATQP